MLRDIQRFLAFGILATAPTAGQAQTVDEVFDKLVDVENAGYRAVDNFLLETDTLGMTTVEYYEKTSALTLDNGQTVYVMRNVPPNEIQERQSAANAMSNASPAELRNAANKIEEAGADMERGMLAEVQSVGLPGGIGTMLMNPPPNQPWLSANPRDMSYMYATMLRGAAAGKEQQAAENTLGDAQQHAQNVEAIKAQTRIAGHENFNGAEALVLLAENLNYTQVSDGTEFTTKTMRMLVDANRYVPLLLTIEGEMNDGNETRAVSIEREDKDYRNVPGCPDMLKPFTSVMRISGIMSPEQQVELAEAQTKLAELETQMASMPPSQRQTMERMMGPQLDMIRNMASGSGIQIESKVVELRCNTGLPDPLEIAQKTLGGAMSGGGSQPMTQDDLLRRIQIDLDRLGYEPGNTNGVLDKPTVVAISRFQAEKGMEVTGQPSPQLAETLSAAVDAPN